MNIRTPFTVEEVCAEISFVPSFLPSFTQSVSQSLVVCFATGP